MNDIETTRDILATLIQAHPDYEIVVASMSNYPTMLGRGVNVEDIASDDEKVFIRQFHDDDDDNVYLNWHPAIVIWAE